MHRGIDTYPQFPDLNHHDSAPQSQLHQPPLIYHPYPLQHGPLLPPLSSPSYTVLKELAQTIVSWLRAVEAKFAAWQITAAHGTAPSIFNDHLRVPTPDSTNQTPVSPALNPHSTSAPLRPHYRSITTRHHRNLLAGTPANPYTPNANLRLQLGLSLTLTRFPHRQRPPSFYIQLPHHNKRRGTTDPGKYRTHPPHTNTTF